MIFNVDFYGLEKACLDCVINSYFDLRGLFDF